MALRFRKSIKLAPGIRWNISGGGSSFTFGPRGATINSGKRGVYGNMSLAGFSSRTRLDKPKPRPAPVVSTVQMSCGISDDGTLTFKDAQGNDMPEHIVEAAKKQNREAILELIQRKCDELNEQVEALGRIHHETPDCRQPITFVGVPFEQDAPMKVKPRRPGLLDRLLPGRRARLEQGNAQAQMHYQVALETWTRARDEHARLQDEARQLLERAQRGEAPAMEQFLERQLHLIEWPRETSVSFEIRRGTVLLDIDLPEIEDMPNTRASVPARGLKLSVKELAATKLQKLYLEHVHGILFRMVGETLAALPTVQTVVASGFSQRRDSSTGNMQDDYLLSIRVRRQEWQQLNFAHLEAVDVVEAVSRYECRREALKSGRLKPITPFDE